MIEIIREEEMSSTTERRTLPKEIKQMGKPDIGERIYIENEAYQRLHASSNIEEKKAYVLLGHFDNYDGKECVFVEAVIYLEEMVFDGDMPMWNDSTWAYIYKQLRREYDRMVIVGWAMDIKGYVFDKTMCFEQLHHNHFGGEHQVFLWMDSLEGEEIFYSSRNGHMCRREGFYVYYDRKNVVNSSQKTLYIEDAETIPTEKELFQEKETFEGMDVKSEVYPWRGNYRKQALEEPQRRVFPSYITTLCLLALVLMLGGAAHSNNEKMAAMEATLSEMRQIQVSMEPTEEAQVAVENVAGNVTKQDETTETLQEVAGVQDVAVQNIEGASTVQTQNVETTQNETSEQTASAQEVEVIQTAPTQTESAEQAVASEPVEEVAQTTIPQDTTAQTYLAQGYYIVQKGDSLAGICKEIYQTTAMMDKLCEVNDIEDENAIYAGQKLILPN